MKESEVTLEEQIAEINKAGWQVLNLFQLDRVKWRCNLFKWETAGAGRDYFCEFAEADSPQWAMALAFQKANGNPKPYRHRLSDLWKFRDKTMTTIPETPFVAFLEALEANLKARQ